jgi:hypothetical protein
MRPRIEDGGYTLSIEYRCEKYEVRDIKSFFFNLFFWLVGRSFLILIFWLNIDVFTSISASIARGDRM